MRSMILVIGCLMGMESVFAETPQTLVGRYTISASSGQPSYLESWVEIRESGGGELELVFNVPCETKSMPRIFKINQASPVRGELELIEQGAGQCYTGQNPRMTFLGQTLDIVTSPRIWTPGFDGTYEFMR